MVKSKIVALIILNKIGNNNKNSTSYKIKKIETNKKLTFIDKLISFIDLKPHS